ncbi:MAG: class I SAM-dependent methyltransferase, partial [Anaerolineae bacterium]|nr:class I SAM-dependent methyltransferase [Anaerolineae bacterium]
MQTTDFEREKHWWNAKAATEEQDRQDEAINRALRWREIERHLDGVETILTVGGGTGVFSIPLAARGYRVTHLDLAPAMIEIARARAGGLETIRFIEGNATDLRFPDRAFDLVLNMDGAISFCGDGAERALKESCRVARHKLIVTVSNRAMMSAVWASESLQTVGRLTPAVGAMLERGEWHQD